MYLHIKYHRKYNIHVKYLRIKLYVLYTLYSWNVNYIICKKECTWDTHACICKYAIIIIMIITQIEAAIPQSQTHPSKLMTQNVRTI